MQELVPEIETDILMPMRATHAVPEMSPNEEIRIRAATIKMLADLTGEPIDPNTDQQVEAEVLAHEMVTNRDARPDFAKYSNSAMAYLAGMVQQSNVKLVEELSDLKLYVVNKLVHEVEHAVTSKDRIAALKHLGEVDGIDAFKKRTEMTVQIKPISEVEQELLSILEGVEYAEIPSIYDDVADQDANSADTVGIAGDNDH